MNNFDFGIQIGDQFRQSDVDLDALEKHTELEYVKFIPCKRGRSDDLVKKNTRDGLAAEHWLVETGKYQNEDTSYRDVKRHNTSVEIKTNTTDEIEQSQIDSLTKRRKNPYFVVADYVISFRRKGGEYTVNRLLVWDGKNYVDVSSEIDVKDVLRSIETMPLESAKKTATDLLEAWDPKKIKGKVSKNKILFDIQKAFTSADICGIMYRLYLRNQGLGVINSKYQQQLRDVF
jgi:hypothetical protein